MEDFDAFADRLDYPMYVLTVPGNGAQAGAGCLVGFATQCSIEPPRFLVCVSKQNHTYTVIGEAEFVGVQLLRDTDRKLAELFGTETGDETDKLARCAWTPRHAGVPILDGCAAWFVGAIEHRVDLGDHVGFRLRPVEVGENGPGAPLMLSAVSDLDAGHDAGV